MKKRTPQVGCDLGRSKGCRRRPTLPRSRERSTIGAVGLNDRVRNGNECGPYALVASDFRVPFSGASLSGASQWCIPRGGLRCRRRRLGLVDRDWRIP